MAKLKKKYINLYLFSLSLYIYLGTFHVVIISFFVVLLVFLFDLNYVESLLLICFSLFCKTFTLLISFFSNSFFEICKIIFRICETGLPRLV